MTTISSNNTYSNSNNNINNSNESKYQKLFIYIIIISFVISIVILIYNSFIKKIRRDIYKKLKELGDYLYELLKEKNYWNKNLEHQSELNPGDQSTEESIESEVNDETINLKNIENNEEKEINIVNVKAFELKDNIEDNKKDNDDNMFLKTFLGRLIITYYSFYGLIFIFNFAIQFLTLIPGTISKFDCKFIKYLILNFYIEYSIFYSRTLLIPVFEFFSFPFIRFEDSLSHLWTFNYIANNKEFKPKYSNKKNEILNLFLMFIEAFYLIGFILGILTSYLMLMDYFNSFILIIIYIYYLSIFFSYFTISVVLWINKKILNKTIKKKILPDINLLSYSFYFSKNEEQDSIKKKKSILYIYIIFFRDFSFFSLNLLYYFKIYY